MMVPTELTDSWWRIPVLLAAAFANGWAEEIVVVAFLITRLRQLRVSPMVALLASSVLRGVYHLYQGYGAGLGYGYGNPSFGIGLTPLGIQSGLTETAIIRGSGGYRTRVQTVSPTVVPGRYGVYHP